MAIVSYRLYCDKCTNDTVVREDAVDDHPWSVNALSNHSGVCPSCSGTSTREDERVPFEDLDSIGESGAENLRDAGIITRQHVTDADDEEILDVSWIGEGGLKSIRQEMRE